MEDNAEVTAKEENIPTEVEEIVHTTIPKNLCEIVLDLNNTSNGNTVVTVENAMEIDQLIAETTGVYSNEIFLHPFYVQPQIPNPKIMLFTGKRCDSPFTVLNLINSSIFMSIFEDILEDLTHPPSFLGKLVIGFWNFDPSIRTVIAIATATDQRLLRLALDGPSDLKANSNPQWLMVRGLVDCFGSSGPSVSNGVAGTTFFFANLTKDQGSCGSYWAFSTIAVVEKRPKIATGELISLSEKETGAIFCLKLLCIINNPTTAVVASGLDKEASNLGEMNVFIFDLGGETIGVSFLTIEDGYYEVEATAGEDSDNGGGDGSTLIECNGQEEGKRKEIN